MFFCTPPSHLNNHRWMSNLSSDKDERRQNVPKKKKGLMESNTSPGTGSCLLC